MRQGYQSTIKGYLYWDGSGSGLLNNSGNWAVLNNNGGASAGGTLYGPWTATGTLTTGTYGGMNSTPTSYGSIGLTSAKNGYYGVLMGQTSAQPNFMWDTGGNGGVYYESGGLWEQYFLRGSQHLNIMTSTDLGYTLGVSGTLYASSSITSPSHCIGGSCITAWNQAGAGDNLGNHIATTTLNLNGNAISNGGSLSFSSTGYMGGGVHSGSTLLNWPGYPGIEQAAGNYVYPGSYDRTWQQSWYLRSGPDWGLYTNTSLDAAGGLYDAQARVYSPNNVPAISTFSNNVPYLYRDGWIGSNYYGSNGDMYLTWKGTWLSTDLGNIWAASNTHLPVNTWQWNHYMGSDGAEYATIFYDTNDSAYYLDPNGSSHLSILGVGTAPAGNAAISATGSSYGVNAHGSSYGVYASASSYGVYGQGGAYGVYGNGDSYGVYGASGTFGVYGQGGSYGLFGQGTSYGVYGCCGTEGVHGTGTSYGISGRGDFSGLYGTSMNYGIYTVGDNNGWSYGGEFHGSNVGAAGIGGNTGVIGNGGWADFYAQGAGTDYASASSIRWKSNIQPIDNALGTVLKLRGVYYDWDKEHGGKTHDMGFIAEEVGKYVPEVVSWDKDAPGYAMGLDYGHLTPILVEAIKQQQQQIDRLEKEIGGLTAQIKGLKK
jgi:hypothetical protein